MLRVIIITICVVCDIWLLHQIWIEERNARTTVEKLFWTLLTFIFHILIVAVYIFLDSSKSKKKDDDDNTTIYM